VNPFERLANTIDRIRSYPPLEVAVELVLIWVIVLVVVRFVQGTRAAAAIRGVLVVFGFVVLTLVVKLVAGEDAFPRLGFILERFLAIVAIALVVVFAPEIRRGVIRVGEARFFRQSPTEVARVVEPIAEACAYLSKSKFGAIIVIEREIGLASLVEGGTQLGAELSARLLQTIFFPGSALHDLAVIVRGRVIRSAAVQLPLADPGELPDPVLGARHRAALGLTAECDALVVVVSEETGSIRLAERGRLSPPLTSEELRQELTSRLRREPPGTDQTEADKESDEKADEEAGLEKEDSKKRAEDDAA